MIGHPKFKLRHLKPYLEEKPCYIDRLMIEKKVERINKVANETVAQRQELHSEVVNVDSVGSLDDRCLDQQINVRRSRKLRKRTQDIGVSCKELIAVHTRVIGRAVPTVIKGKYAEESR
jgi:hypothetical protein